MEPVAGFQWETQTRGNWVFLLHVGINRNQRSKWAQAHFDIQTNDIRVPCPDERRFFYLDLAVHLRLDHEQQRIITHRI